MVRWEDGEGTVFPRWLSRALPSSPRADRLPTPDVSEQRELLITDVAYNQLSVTGCAHSGGIEAEMGTKVLDTLI